MKKVNVRYFKASGKYYTDEDFYIPEGLDGWTALYYEIPKHLRLLSEEGWYAVVEDSEDGKEPFIVPALYTSDGRGNFYFLLFIIFEVMT